MNPGRESGGPQAGSCGSRPGCVAALAVYSRKRDRPAKSPLSLNHSCTVISRASVQGIGAGRSVGVRACSVWAGHVVEGEGLHKRGRACGGGILIGTGRKELPYLCADRRAVLQVGSGFGEEVDLYCLPLVFES